MTHCRTCGVLEDVGEFVICEDCADKISAELRRRMKVCAKHSAFDKENVYEQVLELLQNGVKK